MQCSLAIISYLIVMAIFAWWGFDMTIHRPLEWLGLLMMGILLSFGMGMVLAVVVDVLPEIKTFVRFFFMVLYFSSGAIFPISRFPSYVLPYLQWNPFLHAIELIRGAVFPFYRMLDLVSFEYFAGCAGLMLFIGVGLFKIRSRRMLAIKGIV